MKKIVKVSIPRKAAELILLALNILAKHIADGASSILNILNMSDLQTQAGIADSMHQLSEAKSRDAEQATEKRNNALGIGKNDLSGNVLFYIYLIRDLLLDIYKGNERTLGDWSFEVNADMTVVIPKNAPEIMQLARGILAKHTADGAASPLIGLNMGDLQIKYTIADTQHSLAKTLKREAEEATQDRDLALGHAPEQNSYTPGTVLFSVYSVKDLLLGVFRGRERHLGEWGFDVTASTGGGTAPGTEFINLPVDQTTPGTVTPKIAGKATATGTKQFKLDFGDGNSTIGTVVAGVLTAYPHTYLIPGQYNIKATAITAGALEEFDVLQIDNCKLFGTVTIPANVQLSGIQVPNNLVTRVLMQPACYAFLVSFILYNNNMDTSSVNENLIGLDNSGLLNGIANFGGGTNNAPTGQGIAAKNRLIAKGWTVITN